MDDLTTALVSAIAPLLSGPPFAFFGHSMGSIVAYESIKKLQAQGGPLPCMLYVSAMRSPTLAGMAHDADGIVMHKLPEKEFWATMERRYGKNPDLVSGVIYTEAVPAYCVHHLVQWHLADRTVTSFPSLFCAGE